MATFDYEQWWQLHLRVAGGETLTPQEQADYQDGLAILDYEEEVESQDKSVAVLRQMRRRLYELTQKHSRLQAQSQTLDQQILTLEDIYQKATGCALAV
jgi:hypothetical protein